MPIWKRRPLPTIMKYKTAGTRSKPDRRSRPVKKSDFSLRLRKTAPAPTRNSNPKRFDPWRRIVAAVVMSALTGLLPAKLFAQDTSRAQSGLPTITLQAGMHLIKAEVANTPATQQIGLMHRQALPLNGGMLFIFKRPEVHCFWMKNTPLPLSIAFIDDTGEITNIADMEPNSEQSHCAAKAVRYALEMKQGWFERKGITAGSRLRAKSLFTH